LEFASKKQIAHVGICGQEEANSKTLSLKNLTTGHQEKLSLDQVVQKLLGNKI